jgi:predicted homoserine dehydrogenase-like protein
MVVMRYLFTNNPSQLFQINLLHVYIDGQTAPTRGKTHVATTIGQARHVVLLTVSGQPVSPSTHLIKLT